MHSDRKAAGHIAKAAGVRALVLDFRRSPEHKFPAQTDDVDRAYGWLLAQGYRPEHIVSSGHSIGGNFAVSLAVRLRDNGAPPPAAILSISPWFDMEMTHATLETNAATDRLLSRPLLEFFRESWLGGTGVAFDDPRVNTLHADLADLSPTLLCYGDAELLVGEAIEFAARAQRAGVDVSLHAVPAGQHSFIMGAGRVSEVDEASERIGRWLRSTLSLATPAAHGRCRSNRPGADGEIC
jgi:monoterpene epsilon-lactone hydrolase